MICLPYAGFLSLVWSSLETFHDFSFHLVGSLVVGLHLWSCALVMLFSLGAKVPLQTHSVQHRCKHFLAGVNLLRLTNTVLLLFIFVCCIYVAILSKSSRKWRSEGIFLVLLVYLRVFWNILINKCILAYTFKITAICWKNIFLTKFYHFFV